MSNFSIIRLLKIFSLLFFCINSLLAQERNTVILKSADNLVGSVKNGEQIRELVGNVELLQGNVTLKCDRAIQYFSSNKIEIWGNVTVYQDTFLLFCQHASYYGDSRTTISPNKLKITDGHMTLISNSGKYNADLRQAEFYGNVEVKEIGNTVLSDTLIYQRDSSKLFCYSRVKVLSQENKSIAFADTLQYYRERQLSILTGEPEFLLIDTTKNINHIDSLITDTLLVIDTLFIKGLTLISDNAKKLIFANDSVKVFRNDFSLSSNDLTYRVNDSIIIVRGLPVMWYENNQLTSDSMTIHLVEKSVKNITASRNGFLLSSIDSLSQNTYNQMVGDTIIIFFTKNRLDSSISDGKAIALYYIVDSNGISGAYKSIGNKIKIESEDNKIKNVKVYYGVEDIYYPYSMIVGNENLYNLPRFNIIMRRPNREDYYKFKEKTF
jgi:lipopolysaccharide export system protein LptA